MTGRRGEIWLANLNPIQGSEQAGVRPVLIFQNDAINRAIGTAVVIPLTSNLRRSALPSCVQVAQGEGGLTVESVLLCHQMRVLDESRLIRKLGVVGAQTMGEAETGVLYTLGIRTNSAATLMSLRAAIFGGLNNIWNDECRIASARKVGWDGSSASPDFITINARAQSPPFGAQRDGEMFRSDLGESVARNWLLTLDE